MDLRTDLDRTTETSRGSCVPSVPLKLLFLTTTVKRTRVLCRRDFVRRRCRGPTLHLWEKDV